MVVTTGVLACIYLASVGVCFYFGGPKRHPWLPAAQPSTLAEAIFTSALGMLVVSLWCWQRLRHEAASRFKQPPRCTRCGYELTGLRGPRCPECGETNTRPN
jgi:DNA-directed RNA polymerase subunit RPC12/RpoP